MTSQEKPFDANDPRDAIADITKSAVVDAFYEAMEKARRVRAKPDEQVEALVVGLMVGAVSCASALFHPDGHRELLASLQAYVPEAMDKARDILGLPPLGAPQ